MHTRTEQEKLPLHVLRSLAIEGTSALVEAQRTLLDLVQQENEILLNGVQERLGAFAPAAAFTDLMKRGLDAALGAQQELLTIASKRSLALFEPGKMGRSEVSAAMMEGAGDALDAFVRAQRKFLEAVEEETDRATTGRRHESISQEKTELSAVAREAANALVEAQKRLLDVFGQQMNVNLDLALQSMEAISPAKLAPAWTLAGNEVKRIIDEEKELIKSTMRSKKQVRSKRSKVPGRHQKMTA